VSIPNRQIAGMLPGSAAVPEVDGPRHFAKMARCPMSQQAASGPTRAERA